MEIAIIGGGITGLTTALTLHKVGIPSTVYERSETLNEIGTGVWLQPNAMHILQGLGLEDDIKKEGCILNKMEIAHADLNPVREIKNTIVSDKYGNQTIAIHRGKLQRILYDAFSKVGNVALGMNYQTHTTTDDHISIEFESKTISADIILGADGIKSKVRTSMGLPSIFRRTNQICCRGIARIQLPDPLKKEGKEVWGRKRRFGFSEISENTVYFFTVLNREICPKELNIETLSSQFKDFNPIVSQIINATENLHTAELTDLKRLPKWSNSNTCLLGDAAHATTPNMGQGACQGIEDAYYISQLIKNSPASISDTFKVFEKKRRKKVDYVVNNSWNFGKMAHSSIGQSLLKGIMKITPEKVMNKQMNELYEIEEF
ncbi:MULTISPECIES: FAD-dependent monooxygenase [Flavobacteriaceae]|uniref:FAD-dependent monooxygenase n=1 Tax=Flavobacteriaceae TaxID=49546 RepID=UPI0014922FA4|nr:MULTISPECIES: FAD-dependent monooxygenase [Allomuricauda]MDC6367516.1 FAD-dependent monooxygenase [Muricauda sp. AC10]